MSENYDRPRPTPRGQRRVSTGRQYYPPPRDIGQYASRALPLLPTGVPSGYVSPLSRYAPEKSDEHQHSSNPFSVTNKAETSRQNTTSNSEMNNATNEVVMAMAMARPSRITIPEHQPYENPNLVSPQPQRPDSRLMSLWANGDGLVSPVSPPGTTSWKTHIVSPMSENSEGESWFDDTSSDEGEQAESSNPAEEVGRPEEATFPAISHLLSRKMSLRHSDPGSPLSVLAGGFGEPGPDVGRSQHLDNLSGRQTVQPQSYAQSTYIGDEPYYPQDADVSMGELTIAFTVPNIDTSAWGRPGADQRPISLSPQPEEQPAQKMFVETPFSGDTSSELAQRSVFRIDETGIEQQRQRSGFGGFDTSAYPPVQSIQSPPPGFTEVFSRLDSQGVVSTAVPRVRGMLSKAKHGLGIGSDEARREKRREEFKRQIHHNTQSEV
ncbi:hypothetical protein F5Y14DRAFT_437647 [Nemania sp. NC0429]|nr:hypothetical protein F5Y14DRAFT_437647 [Nemania sp. NC0429]